MNLILLSYSSDAFSSGIDSISLYLVRSIFSLNYNRTSDRNYILLLPPPPRNNLYTTCLLWIATLSSFKIDGDTKEKSIPEVIKIELNVNVQYLLQIIWGKKILFFLHFLRESKRNKAEAKEVATFSNTK